MMTSILKATAQPSQMGLATEYSVATLLVARIHAVKKLEPPPVMNQLVT
jgi:hypothetical protein